MTAAAAALRAMADDLDAAAAAYRAAADGQGDPSAATKPLRNVLARLLAAGAAPDPASLETLFGAPPAPDDSAGPWHD